MVEVDPSVLLVAGTVIAGLAIVFSSCLKPAEKPQKKKPEIEHEAAVPVIAAPSKPKRKSKSKSKSKGTSSPVDTTKSVPAEVVPSPAPTIVVKAVEKVVSVDEDEEEDEEEERLTPEIFVPAEAKKSKKAKETQEQKLARLEREKIRKEVQKVQEEESIYAASALSRQNDFQFHSQASHPSFDGWAVVEGRKLKVKRNESTSDLDDVANVVSTPTPIATTTTAPVEEAQTPPPVPVESVTKQLSVEARKLGLLIGPKGVTKIGLQNATGTEINMPKAEKDYTGPVEISITGTNEGVDRAIFALNEMVVKGYSTILASPDFHEGYVEVKPKFLPDIIGKGGASIKAIQQHTGVKISTPTGYTRTSPSGETIVPSKVKIVLAGPKDKVALARNLILDLTKYFHTPVTHPGLVHIELDIPASYYNYIIGSKGSEIKHIQANYKVTVYIPGAESSHDHLLIVGEETAVQNAEKHIRRLMEKVDIQAAERARIEAEGAVLGENARARFAAVSANAAASANENREPRSNSRGPRAPRADGASASGKGGKNNTAAGATADASAEKDEDRHEEWMNEFAPRRAPINLGGMLPATAKFAAAPPALPAPTAAISEEKKDEAVAASAW